MSLLYRDSSGNETPIAGLNGLSGQLVPSVSYYQTGTVMLPGIASGSYERVTVTLATPMPDTDYVVVTTDPNGGTAGGLVVNNVTTALKTTTSFAVTVRNVGTTFGEDTYLIKWQAFKLMTDESRAVDEAAIATNTANIASLTTALNGKASLDFSKSVYTVSGGTKSVTMSIAASELTSHGGLGVARAVGNANAPLIWIGMVRLSKYGSGAPAAAITEIASNQLTAEVTATGVDPIVLTFTTTNVMYNNLTFHVYG